MKDEHGYLVTIDDGFVGWQYRILPKDEGAWSIQEIHTLLCGNMRAKVTEGKKVADHFNGIVDVDIPLKDVKKFLNEMHEITLKIAPEAVIVDIINDKVKSLLKHIIKLEDC